jgi:hypothetical protein
MWQLSIDYSGQELTSVLFELGPEGQSESPTGVELKIAPRLSSGVGRPTRRLQSHYRFHHRVSIRDAEPRRGSED